MKLQKLCLFGLFVSLCACTTPYEVMISPELNEYREFGKWGYGVFGTAEAQKDVSDRAKGYEAIGFKRAEDLTVEERARLRLKAEPIVFMVQSQSGDLKVCKVEGPCVEQFRASGWKKAENLTAEDQQPKRNIVAMVHLKSGHVKYCAPSVPKAFEAMALSSCVKKFQILDYKRAEDLTVEERARLRLND